MPYTVLTMFKTAADYRDDAISALKQMKEISLANGSQGVRIGMMQSGSNVGNFVAIQFYENMGKMEAVYDALHEAPIVKEAQGSGRFSVVRRGVMKVLTSFGVASADDAKYVTLTFGTADDPTIEPITKFANVLTKNGALGGRYGPITIGDYANGKTYLFGATYPSTSAIESAYDAVAADGTAEELYKQVSVQRRQVIRLIG